MCGRPYVLDPYLYFTSLLFILMSMQVCVCVHEHHQQHRHWLHEKKRRALWHWQTHTHRRGEESSEIREDGGESEVICIYELKLFATDWVCITRLNRTAGLSPSTHRCQEKYGRTYVSPMEKFWSFEIQTKKRYTTNKLTTKTNEESGFHRRKNTDPHVWSYLQTQISVRSKNLVWVCFTKLMSWSHYHMIRTTYCSTYHSGLSPWDTAWRWAAAALTWIMTSGMTGHRRQGQ